jgi:hypothetical protein
VSTATTSQVIRAVAILDVPVSVVEGLVARHGEELWKYVVRNVHASLSGVRAARVFFEGEGRLEIEWIHLMQAVVQGAPGVRHYIAGESRSPDWLIKWIVDERLLSEEDQNILVRSDRGEGLRWYLAIVAPLSAAARAETKKRSDGILRLGNIEGWRKVEETARRMGAGLAERERIDPNSRRNWSAAARQEAEEAQGEVVQYARAVLGDGQEGTSLVAWARFFDLVEAGGSSNLVDLVDAVGLSLAWGN